MPVAVIAFNMLLDKNENNIISLNDKVDRNACVSLILDPCYKVDSFDLTDWGRELKVQSLVKLKNIYKEN